MSQEDVNPVSSNERIEVVDVLRGLAVCGILIGNMQWFSGYGMMPPALASQSPAIDHITHFFVHFFVEGKFYSIFSFLFGFGFALQITRAGERGDTKASVFKRRLFWLLVIGVLHATLLWAGDILSVYALMGFVLLLFRKKSQGSLIKWSAILLAVPILTYILIYVLFSIYVSPEQIAQFEAGQADMWNREVPIVSQGSYTQIISSYNIPYLIGRWAGLIIQMRLPKILAMFLLGMYAYRRGIFQRPSEHMEFIRKILMYGLLLGVAGNVIFAAAAENEAPFPPSTYGVVGVIAYAFGVPALALSIAAGLVLLWQMPMAKTILSILAPVGRMALTNYLLQTVTCIVIFYGFGFGLYGSVGAAKATAIAIVIFASQIVLSTLWLKFFNYGPMEWLWRQLTYGKRLELRQRPRIADPTY
jgi:uncharacterized protein